MVVEAFFYMYIVAAGASLGVASVVLLSWRMYLRIKNHKPRKRKGVVR